MSKTSSLQQRFRHRTADLIKALSARSKWWVVLLGSKIIATVIENNITGATRGDVNLSNRRPNMQISNMVRSVSNNVNYCLDGPLAYTSCFVFCINFCKHRQRSYRSDTVEVGPKIVKQSSPSIFFQSQTYERQDGEHVTSRMKSATAFAPSDARFITLSNTSIGTLESICRSIIIIH